MTRPALIRRLTAVIWLAALALLGLGWRRIPARVAVHYTMLGAPDRLVDKGLEVAAPMLIGTLTLAGLWLSSWALSRRRPSVVRDRNLEILARLQLAVALPFTLIGAVLPFAQEQSHLIVPLALAGFVGMTFWTYRATRAEREPDRDFRDDE